MRALVEVAAAPRRSGDERGSETALIFYPAPGSDRATIEVGESLSKAFDLLLGVLTPESARQIHTEASALIARPEAVDPVEYERITGEPLPPRAEQLALRLQSLFDSFARRQALLEGALTVDQVAGLLNISSRKVETFSRSPRRFFSVRDRSERRFPVWQFDAMGEEGVLPGLPTILRELKLVPDFQLLAWFLTKQPELDGATPVEALKSGRNQVTLDSARALRFSTPGAAPSLSNAD